MASATAKPQKKLGEFLKEQQEPFVLQVYLLERGYSKKWCFTKDQDRSSGDSGKCLERSASSDLNKKRKALLPFSRVLTAVYKKVAFHNESTTTRDSDNRDGDNSVRVLETGRVDQMFVETDRFSSASSSTVFNSCSEIGDEEETWISPHKDHPSFSSDTCQASNVCKLGVRSQQATNNGKHRGRCIKYNHASPDETMNQDVGRMEQRMPSCGVLLPRKITEDSLLSAALWGFLIQSAKKEGYSMELRELLGPNVSQILKSKRALQKTKQLLFDCVREIAETLPRKDNGQKGYKQLLGPEELGKLICDKTKEWGQQAADKTNLTYLLNLDYLNSVKEWSNFDPHMKDISFEIADEILERISNEIVSEMIEILTSTIC